MSEKLKAPLPNWPTYKNCGNVHLFRQVLRTLLIMMMTLRTRSKDSAFYFCIIYIVSKIVCRQSASAFASSNFNHLSRIVPSFLFIMIISGYVLFTFLFIVSPCWILWIVWRGSTRTTLSGWMQWSLPLRTISKSTSGDSELWLHRFLPEDVSLLTYHDFV